MAKARPTDYATLRKIWYKKLKKSGFDDIESKSGMLRGRGQDFSRPRAEWQGGGFEAKAEYYRLAMQFLYEYEFQTKRERVIWEYHANGISVRDIAKILKKAKQRYSHRDAVDKTVQSLRETMKQKYIPRYKS